MTTTGYCFQAVEISSVYEIIKLLHDPGDSANSIKLRSDSKGRERVRAVMVAAPCSGMNGRGRLPRESTLLSLRGVASYVQHTPAQEWRNFESALPKYGAPWTQPSDHHPLNDAVHNVTDVAFHRQITVKVGYSHPHRGGGIAVGGVLHLAHQREVT